MANPALAWGCGPQGIYIDVATAPSAAHVEQVERALAMFDRASPHSWPRSTDPKAPVRIRWSADAIDGEGGITYLGGTSSAYVGADVVLATANGVERTLGVTLHELGHVAGLAHVEDGRQAMTIYPWSPITRYGVGDLVGLMMADRPCVVAARAAAR